MEFYEGRRRSFETAKQCQKSSTPKSWAIEAVFKDADECFLKKQFLSLLEYKNGTMNLHESWKKVLHEEFQKPYFESLIQFVASRRHSKVNVYPFEDQVFNAFNITPFEKVKVVILGQDPYHNPGQAHGLSFSVPNSVKLPASLRNIYKELSEDLGVEIPKDGCLISWAEQGVLLLNSILTVEENKPLSHHNKGWEKFTDAVIEKLGGREDPVIFVLWGESAKKKCSLLGNNARILSAAHPSPLSARRGFFGCKHFSKTNNLLKSLNKTQIKWV